MKRFSRQFTFGLLIVVCTFMLTACGGVRLSSFGNLTLKKFIKTLNKNIAQYSTDVTVPELTETVVTTDKGDITVYTSAVSSTILLMIVPSDSGQILYLRQSKDKESEDSVILADDQIFATVSFALMRTADKNADVYTIVSNLGTDLLWNTAAVTDADGFHYFYQNRDDANVLVVQPLDTAPTETASAK